MGRRFDAIIVGSGFGGSVVTWKLADAGLNVCLLERGQRWAPGSFPRSPDEMRANFWDPSEGLYGLFDLWSFRDLEVVAASGLGGGSLIYANVLLRKDPTWYPRDERLWNGDVEDWPISDADLAPHYVHVEQVLRPTPYPFAQPPYDATPKTRALRDAARAAGLDFRLPPLAVTFQPRPGAPPACGEEIHEPRPNLHGCVRVTCRLCGECDVGCNYGSKNTLDLTFLSEAERAGADIRDCCEVKVFGRNDGGSFFVRYLRHDPRRPPDEVRTESRELHEIQATRVILAAGALGSTYLLLRNRHRLHRVSDRLGLRVCGNGDFLGFVGDAREPDPARPGHARPRSLAPSRGPVITGAVRLPDRLDGAAGRGAYVEEGGLPAFALWAAQGFAVPGWLRRGLRFAGQWLRARLSSAPRSDVGGDVSRLLGDPHASGASLPFLGMGRDVPDGRMALRGRYLALDWSPESSDEHFTRVREAMRTIAEGLDGRYRDTPLRLLRRAVTVHPLGGCSMGVDRARGVVDPFGAVFDNPGLYVADGSVLPGSVGPNPSLTIAAFADRVAEHILRRHAKGEP
jgi:cholesterol oxidase